MIRTKSSGDIEQNPGPKPNSCHYLSLESLQYFGAQLYQIAIHKYSCCMLIRKYVKASVTNDDDSLEVPGCNLFKADHPCNTK